MVPNPPSTAAGIAPKRAAVTPLFLRRGLYFIPMGRRPVLSRVYMPPEVYTRRSSGH